jgi:deoxyribodipyrimidine photo-lyase
MTTIHWFRNDLRVHDHRVLGTLPSDVQQLLCIYVVDDLQWRPTTLGFVKTGPDRTRFLLETLRDLDASLQRLGNRLVVVHGDPASVLARAVADTGAAYVTTDAHVTSEELDVDARVRACIGVPLHRAWTSTMLHPQDLPEHPERMPDTFSTWRRTVERDLRVRPEHAVPTALPPPPAAYRNAPLQTHVLMERARPHADERSAMPFPGGETSALDRLEGYVWRTQGIVRYKQTRNGLIGTEYSSKFSPWLAVGALSARRIYHEVRRFEAAVQANDSTHWLIIELLWRDYFRFMAIKYGSRLFHRRGMKGASVSWRHDAAVFEAWRTGRTGNDFVDANMRELLHTGWMSNRGRQNVASWLTKAKHIDWRWGAAWFEHALVDYDVCSNWANWAYVAGVGNDPREDRFFNTAKQAELYDPVGEYRRMWLTDTTSTR